MSTINVSNITDGTDTVGTSYVLNGSAKAWVNFNGTGTIAIRESLNMSSLTDAGVGVYYNNLTSNMLTADYCTVMSASDAYPDIGNCIALLTDVGAMTTARFGMVNINENTSSYFDSSRVCTSANGDLA